MTGASSVSLSWGPVPFVAQNGEILGYKVNNCFNPKLAELFERARKSRSIRKVIGSTLAKEHSEFFFTIMPMSLPKEYHRFIHSSDLSSNLMTFKSVNKLDLTRKAKTSNIDIIRTIHLLCHQKV